MRSLRARKSRRGWGGTDLMVVLVLHLHSSFSAGAGCRHVDPACGSHPATREELSQPREDASLTLTWRGFLVTLPCALSMARGIRPGAATADAGPIHHPQASIGLWASFVCNQRLASRAAQRPLVLAGQLSTREAASDPAQSPLWWPISL